MPMTGESVRLSQIATALASETRAEMVTALMGGTAHTGRELARHVGVAASTASEHLGMLVDTGLVAVEAQGRHRFFRLASPDVASLVETLLEASITIEPLTPTVTRRNHSLAYARACYDHLAGELGVQLYDRLVALGALAVDGDGDTGSIALTPAGEALCDRLDIARTAKPRKRPLVRTCLDWTQRRHHLAGELGATMLSTMIERGWIRRVPAHPRELRLTDAGRRALSTHLGVEVR